MGGPMGNTKFVSEYRNMVFVEGQYQINHTRKLAFNKRRCVFYLCSKYCVRRLGHSKMQFCSNLIENGWTAQETLTIHYTHLSFRRTGFHTMFPSPLQVLCITTSDGDWGPLAGKVNSRSSTDPRTCPWGQIINSSLPSDVTWRYRTGTNHQ